MVEVKANLRYVRVAPRKARLLADLIRGKSLKDAIAQVSFSGKKLSPALLKFLKSAESNAKNNFKLDSGKLRIKKVRVDEGPALKRYKPMSRGRASMIKRRSSHISLVLEENKKS